MNPEDPYRTPQPAPQTQEFSIDYLNQIAGPSKPQRSGPSKLVMIIALTLGALAIVLFAFIMIGGRSSSSDKLIDISLRLDTLQSIADTQQKHLRDNSLRSTNSTLKLSLSNTISQFGEPLKNNSVNTKKIPKDTVATEATYKKELSATFDDALLNGTLDRTYAREMSYQLTALRATIRSADAASSSASLNDFATSAEANLEPINVALADFAGSK